MTPEEIKRIRDTLGMTQEKFAQALGVSVRSITDWENGKSTPRGLSLAALTKLKRKADRQEKTR